MKEITNIGVRAILSHVLRQLPNYVSRNLQVLREVKNETVYHVETVHGGIAIMLEYQNDENFLLTTTGFDIVNSKDLETYLLLSESEESYHSRLGDTIRQYSPAIMQQAFHSMEFKMFELGKFDEVGDDVLEVIMPKGLINLEVPAPRGLDETFEFQNPAMTARLAFGWHQFEWCINKLKVYAEQCLISMNPPVGDERTRDMELFRFSVCPDMLFLVQIRRHAPNHFELEVTLPEGDRLSFTLPCNAEVRWDNYEEIQKVMKSFHQEQVFSERSVVSDLAYIHASVKADFGEFEYLEVDHDKPNSIVEELNGETRVLRVAQHIFPFENKLSIYF